MKSLFRSTRSYRGLLVALMCSLALISSEGWAQEIDSTKVSPSSLLQLPPYIRVPPTQRTGFICAEQMPVYPGGYEAMTRFIAENTVYPATATKTGRVFVHFWINRSGEVDSTRIINGLEPALDAEALRVINSLGKFTPAIQHGRHIAIPFTVPVNFPPVLPEPSKHRKKHKS